MKWVLVTVLIVMIPCGLYAQGIIRDSQGAALNTAYQALSEARRALVIAKEGGPFSLATAPALHRALAAVDRASEAIQQAQKGGPDYADHRRRGSGKGAGLEEGSGSSETRHENTRDHDTRDDDTRDNDTREGGAVKPAPRVPVPDEKNEPLGSADIEMLIPETDIEAAIAGSAEYAGADSGPIERTGPPQSFGISREC